MIRFIHDIDGEPVGGKARGLRILQDLGLNVPDAFVIVHPQVETLDEGHLRTSLKKLGDGPKAVRSSAVSEDGHQTSFAGQFETYLHLTTYEEIKLAILNCIEAAQGDRVRSYSDSLTPDADTRISVILQNMVDASVAGVVFTANPVTNRRDVMIINAVAGHGEDLVSGKKDAHHYEIYHSGSNLFREASKNGKLLKEENLREIMEGAKKAEKHFGVPVDMEWAIDQAGKLNWLQVRPITALDDVHYNELDTVKGPSNEVWTLGNIGEMMPGVATPLTYSVSVYGIDYGLAVLAAAAGVIDLNKYKPYVYIQMFYNRLFFNMTNMMEYSRRIWQNKRENIITSVSARDIPEIKDPPHDALPVRVWNFICQQAAINYAGPQMRKAVKLALGFRVDLTGNLEEDYAVLCNARGDLCKVFGYHIITSAQSGTYYAAFMGILTGQKREPGSEDHHLATRLLSDIPGIESVDVVNSLEKFSMLIRLDKAFAGRFRSCNAADALNMLQQDAPENIREAFRVFLQRHGHRCIRESELREKPWGIDPMGLIQLLQVSVTTKQQRFYPKAPKLKTRSILSGLPFAKQIAFGFILRTARRSVARREITKSASIRVLNEIRKGWIQFAGQLVKEGLLEDTDQVFFLTQDEIGDLIRTRDPGWKVKASKRRTQLPETDKLTFDLMSPGIPEPLQEEEAIDLHGNALSGLPVSSGIIEGPARIINNLEEARSLNEGDIMVVSFTDIGWTPYFSIIGGLVTEIGSPLSHGAVVAREYGIPAIVAAKGARKFLKEGQRVRLDGNRGVVEVI